MAWTAAQRTRLDEIATELGTDPAWLANLVDFESGGDPHAENPNSSARGLLQWIDSRARDLGYDDSAHLILENPTVDDQLEVILADLSRFPYLDTPQKLYMSVFYPAAMHWPPTKQFPDTVTSVNPGIHTPADYVALVDGTRPVDRVLPVVGLLALVGLSIYLIRRR